MGLYLAIFDDEDEIDGVEVGFYSDFELFRGAIREKLEDNYNGSRYPTLMNHVDCEGEWSPAECKTLYIELKDILQKFEKLEPFTHEDNWQAELISSDGLAMNSLADCFIDVDGEPLIKRLMSLCEVSIQHDLPITFQ